MLQCSFGNEGQSGEGFAYHLYKSNNRLKAIKRGG